MRTEALVALGLAALAAPVLAQLAARDRCCPGHLEANADDMPDAYLAADLRRMPSGGQGLKAQHAMRS